VETIDYLNDNFVIKAGIGHYVFDQNGQYLSVWDMGTFSEFYDYTCIQGNILHYLADTGNDEYMYHLNRLIEPDEFEELYHYKNYENIYIASGNIAELPISEDND
jgi:hypothetical protein